VVPKTSRPFHLWQGRTLPADAQEGLRRQRFAVDLAELQAQLDAFVDYYNHHRPHRGIGRITPAERWAATPPAINLGAALPGPALHTVAVVAANGVVAAGRYRIGVGTSWAGRAARVDHDDTHFAVFIDHRLVRAGTIDPARDYQGITGRRNKRHLP
jgi:Integrase core domain